MPLTDDEKQRARYHLGYPSLNTLASIQLGVPALTQTNFLVENNLARLMESALPQVRSILKTMDDIELKLIDSQDRLAATQLSDLYLNNNEANQLEGEYRRWGYRLSDIVGAPIYPYASRYRMQGGVQNIAIRSE